VENWEKDFLQQLKTPSSQPETPADNRIGFAENIKRGGVGGVMDRATFGIKPTVEAVQLYNATKRLQLRDYNNSDDGYAQWREDRDRVTKYLEEQAEIQERGLTIPAKVGNVAFDMLPFMVEFIATGGLASLGKAGARRGILKLAGKYAKTATAKTAARIGGAMGSAAVRTAATPHHIVEGYYKRRLPDMQFNQDGKIEFTDPDEKPSTAFLKAAGDHFIEMLSEVSGAGIGKAGKATAKAIIPKQASNSLGKIYNGLKNAWIKAAPKRDAMQFAQKMATQAGFHGILEEMGEERLGDVLRATFNIEDFGAGKDSNVFQRLVKAIPGGEQLAVEALAFSVPGVVKMGAAGVYELSKSKPARSEIEDDPSLEVDSEAENITESEPKEQSEQPVLGTDQFPVQEIPIDSLSLSKDVPNFKEDADPTTGVVRGEELQGEYIRLPSNPIIVWERKDGRLEVITGRHRLDLARRNGEKTIPAQIVRENDGFTLAMALTLDAESNIRDGQGKTKDYAQYFRNTEIEEDQARQRGLLRNAKGKAGFRIGKSAVDDVYSAFLGGKLSEAKAYAIANGAPNNESAQLAAAAKADKMSPDELEQYARILNRTKPSDRIKATQGNLFGFDESALIEAEAVAKEVSKEEKALKERILAVKGALRRPETARKMGLEFTDEASIRAEVARLEERLDSLKRVATNPELYDEMKRRAGLESQQQTAAKASKYDKDLLGQDVIPPLGGKQGEFLDIEDYRLSEPDIEGQMTLLKEEAPKTRAKTTSSIGKQALAATNEIDRKEIKVSLEPQSGKPMTAGEIVRQLERDFKIPIRGKATHVKKNALGWFSPREVGIRMKDVREITTATHEIGHHIDWTLNKRLSKNPPTKEIAAELTDLGKALYGSKQPAGGYKSEGWAEFMRMYLTGEDTQEAAPHLHDWFTGEYLPQHTDIAKNIARAKQMITNWRLQGADSMVDGFMSGKVKTTIGDMLERLSFAFHKNWRDKFHVLKKLRDKAGQLRPSEDPFELATAFSQKAPAKARQFVLEKTTDMAGNVTGKGLREILAPIQNIREFARYAVAKRARLLNNRGIKSGLSDAVIDYTLNKYQSEQYDQVLKELTDWNHRVIDYLVEAGGMETKVASNIKAMNPVYVPFLRTFAEDEIIAKGGGFGKGFKPGKAVHKIKGSGREIKDIFESMILNTQRTIEIAHKSAVSRSIAKLADRPAMAGWIWKVPAPKQATSFSAEQLKKDIARLAVTKLGLDPHEANLAGYMEHWDDILTIYTNAHQYYGKDNIVSVVVDGQRQWFEVHPELYKAMEGIDQNSKDIIWKMLYYGPGRISRGVRLGATGLNPSFGLIRNFIRDAMTFSVLRKHSKRGALGAAKGVIDDVRNTEAAKRFKALGGKMSGYIGQDRRGLKAIKSELFASNGKKYALHTVLHPVDALRELFGITETGVRIAEFEAAYKDAAAKYGEGTLDAAIYALNQAQDVTTNFTRHGVYAKYLNQLIPFFNAAIQGPDKIIRTFKERPIEAAIRSVAYLTIPAIGLWWKYKDEDWYKNLPDYEKINYLHFRFPGTETIVRLPVPFELGHVFQSMPVAALDSAYNDRPEEFTGSLVNILDQANPFGSRWLIGGIPAVGIAVQLIANKDWAGRPIVPMSAQGRLPADQYGPYTTELMKHIGKALNVSPAKLEYAVDNLSGGLYRRTIRGAEVIAGQRDYETGLSDMPVLGTLFTRDPYAPQAQIERFYKRRDALNRKYQSKAITKPETRERAAYNKIGDMLSLYWKKLHNAKTVKERKEIYEKIGKLIEKAEGFSRRTNRQKEQ